MADKSICCQQALKAACAIHLPDQCPTRAVVHLLKTPKLSQQGTLGQAAIPGLHLNTWLMWTQAEDPDNELP